MIEINHQQARRLIRQRADGRRLPDAQWAILQAHLEGCAACRAYASRRAELERQTAQTLRGRWGIVDARRAAPRELAQQVTAARARRARSLRLAAWVALAGVVFLTGWWLTRSQAAARAAQTAAGSATATAQAAAAANLELQAQDAARDTFRGLLVYAAQVDGNADIFLLNRREAGADGAEITNLTGHPAQDVAPVWSPDGQWIAFLSNRAADGTVGAHYELYTVSVAGTRLTQLTDAPDVAWQGPVTWSADGQTLALTGIRAYASQRPFVYLVPVGAELADGSREPRALAYTSGALGPLRFSPQTRQLAYAGPPDFGGLIVYHMTERDYYPLAPPEGGSAQPFMELFSPFDWTPDGLNLAYLSYGMPDVAGITGLEASLWLTTRLNLDSGGRSDEARQVLLDRVNEREGLLRGISVSPADHAGRMLAAALANPRAGGCWVVKLYAVDPGGAETVTRVLDGFCVQGSLRHENWSADGGWLIVTGRPADGGAAEGLYALRVPRDRNLAEASYFARLDGGAPLAPEPGMQIKPVWDLAQPALRPAVPFSLGLELRAAASSLPAPAPVAPPVYTPGTILYETRAETGSQIYALSPGGGERRLAAESALARACPALAPGGQQFAYLDNGPATSGVPVVLVAGLDGKTDRMFTASARDNGAGGLEMSCPVWSPDGQNLAWIVYRPQENFIKFVSVGGLRDGVARIAPPSYDTPPVWTPDGSAVLYASPRAELYGARILAARLPEALQPSAPTAEWAARTILEDTPPRTGYNIYDDIIKLAVSPEGALGFIQIGWLNEGAADLYELTAEGGFARLSDLPSPKFGANYRAEEPVLLEYLPDGSLLAATRHDVDALHKSILWIYERAEKQRRPLAYLETPIYAAALSPDGSWLVFSSDRGLYALSLAAARRGAATPYLLADQPVYGVDWK